MTERNAAPADSGTAPAADAGTDAGTFLSGVEAELNELRARNLWKEERVLAGPQGARVCIAHGQGEPREVLNLCANNYLGLARSPDLKEAAREALAAHGLGMASVRFICGTSALHRALESELADWLKAEDAVLYPSCFDANGGLFEPLLDARDAVVSDALNHASIIDGIRLCKARRLRYANGDLNEAEACLAQAQKEGARRVLIATDGVFSMDGFFAPLAGLRALADRYGAWLMVDDCHAAGFIGPEGAGSPARAGVKAEIITGTFGKALGGTAGGYVAAPRAICELLRQRSRPYLFSNALPPPLAAAALAAVRLVRQDAALRARPSELALLWRGLLEEAGLELLPGEHPIVPVMLADAGRAKALADALWEEGVHAAAFSYPVVPEGQARIRTQISAELEEEDLRDAAAAFARAAERLGLLA